MRIHLLRPNDINPAHWYGVSRYATELVAAMKRLDASLEFFSLYPSLRGRVPQQRREALEQVGVELRAARVPNLSRCSAFNRFAQRWVLPRLVARAGCDISWGTNCDALRKYGNAFRTVVTIHDLFLLTHPELSESHFTALVAPTLRRTAQQADLVLTVSRFTRDQILKLLEVDEQKVVVTTSGVASTLDSGNPDGDEHLWETPHAPLAPGSDYILSVGTVEPRKNYVRGLQVYRLLQRRLNHLPPWIIVGRDGWKFEGFYAARQRMNLEDKVQVLHDVTDRQLAAVYRNARCLFCPSLIEGFGLSIAEAMKAGVPVVCSSGGALPEVGADAVLTADPTDTEGLADALARVLCEPECANQMVARGKLRAARFTWERGAREVIEAFRRLREAA